MERESVLHLTPGTPVFGLWCARCALPSKFRVHLYRLSPTGVARMGSLIHCTNHGGGVSDG
jgi:hypothetical protein